MLCSVVRGDIMNVDLRYTVGFIARFCKSCSVGELAAQEFSIQQVAWLNAEYQVSKELKYFRESRRPTYVTL
jgi:hypothetical protein